MIKKFSFPKTQNRQLIFSPKKPYDLVAERSEATASCLQFPVWCSILKIVRTHFAACGGEEVPSENERLRREPNNFQFFFGGIQFRIRKANTKCIL